MIDEIITGLDLELCADAQVGTIYKRGISGGQQRRVCIGYELLAEPELLMLDEPTSGLVLYNACHMYLPGLAICTYRDFSHPSSMSPYKWMLYLG